MVSNLTYSFEFFPPRSTVAEAEFNANIIKLTPYAPSFMTVTYGAGGSTNKGSLDTLRLLAKLSSHKIAGHLACAGATKEEVNATANEMWELGVQHIVAIRGDAVGPGPYQPHPNGYPYTTDLIAGLCALKPFEISVACYPEKHPDAPSAAADLDVLRRKFEAGAHRAISQFFFDADTFLRFRDRAVDLGIKGIIVPGILPPTNFKQVKKFAAQCQASISPRLVELMDKADEASHPSIAIDYIAEMCRKLHANGLRHFHFYTLNKATSVKAILDALGVKLPRNT